MTVDERLVEAAEALRYSTRDVTRTVKPPLRRKVAKGPVLALASGLLVLALAGIPAMLLSADISPRSGVDGGAELLGSIGTEIPSGVGSDGLYFGIEDPSWAVAYVWQPEGSPDGSFILYENGSRQISTMTGSVAEDALVEIRESSGEVISEEGAVVTEYVWVEGVSYVWHTSDGRAVVVTIGQMSPDEAKTAAGLVESLDRATFDALLASHPVTPTTLGRSP